MIKNVYIDKLDNVVDKYNNIFHRTNRNEADRCKFEYIY